MGIEQIVPFGLGMATIVFFAAWTVERGRRQDAVESAKWQEGRTKQEEARADALADKLSELTEGGAEPPEQAEEPKPDTAKPRDQLLVGVNDTITRVALTLTYASGPVRMTNVDFPPAHARKVAAAILANAAVCEGGE